MSSPGQGGPEQSCGPSSVGEASRIKGLLLKHYDELHSIAAKQMAGENAGHSMQTTALVNEVVCKLLDGDKKVAFNDGKHFLATANVMMQHILIDRARRKGAQKAGGQMTRQVLHDNQVRGDDDFVNMLILQEELQLLAKHDPEAAAVISKRCQGYSMEEVAGQLGISRTAAYQLWTVGQAWLMQMFHERSSQS